MDVEMVKRRVVVVVVVCVHLVVMWSCVHCQSITSSTFRMTLNTQLSVASCTEVGGAKPLDRMQCAVTCSMSGSCQGFSFTCSDPLSPLSCRCYLCTTGDLSSASSVQGARSGVRTSQVVALTTATPTTTTTTTPTTTTTTPTTTTPTTTTTTPTTTTTISTTTTPTTTTTTPTTTVLQPYCSSPPLIARTIVTHTVTSGHDVATYSCSVSTDVYVRGTTQVTCSSGSNWPTATIICAPTTCWYLHPGVGPLYAGTLAQAENGKQCQIWADNTPQSKNAKYDDPNMYPSDNYVISAANNYCRIFNDNYWATWCYWNEPSGFIGFRKFSDCAVSECVQVAGTRGP